MPEAEVEHMVIGALHSISNSVSTRFHLAWLDDAHFKQRNDGHRDKQRHH